MWYGVRLRDGDEKARTRGELVATIASAEYRSLPQANQKALFPREAGFSLGSISTAMGIPKTTVTRWCTNSDIRSSAGRPSLLSESQERDPREFIDQRALERKPVTYAVLRAKVH